MGKRFTDAAVLDALWAWCGHVEEAARSIGMNRGQFYDRLSRLGVGPQELRYLRDTGILKLSGWPDESGYAPTPGTVRYLQPVQDSLLVRMKSGDLPPNLVENVSATQTTPTTRRLSWAPKPSRATIITFEQAVLDLAKVGKDTTKDALLDLLAGSQQFQQFIAEAVALYRSKSERDRE